MTHTEPTRPRPADYTLVAHRPDGSTICRLACSPDYPLLRRLLLAHGRREDRTRVWLLILPADHLTTDRVAAAAPMGARA